MSTWAKEKAACLRAEEQARRVESERFIAEERLRRHLAPRLWMELREWLKQSCQEFNLEVGKDVLLFELQPQSAVVVRRLDKPRILHIEYDQEAQRIGYQSGDERGEYLFLVNTDSTVVFGTANHIPYGVEEIGARLLDLLVR